MTHAAHTAGSSSSSAALPPQGEQLTEPEYKGGASDARDEEANFGMDVTPRRYSARAVDF